MQQMKVGQVAESEFIDRLAAKPGEKYIFAILSEDMVFARVHWDDKPADGGYGLNYFHCFDKECCQQFGIPTQKFVLPALEYKGNVNDLENYTGPMEFKHIAFTRTQYMGEFSSLLQTMKVKGEHFLERDFLMTGKGDPKFPQFSLDSLGACKWRELPEAAAAVEKGMNRYRSLIYRSLGQEMDSKKFLLAISKVSGMSAAGEVGAASQAVAVPAVAESTVSGEQPFPRARETQTISTDDVEDLPL